MAEEVVLNINVNGEASIGEVKNLKQQFAEAEDALFALAGAGKEGTKEFRKAQQEAANLKERVDDINESLDDLKPEAKLGAFSKVAGGLASGFTAATGAAALFGAESEDLQKQLVKVQAAMAFSEGLRGLGDLADGFKTLKVVILSNPLFLITGIVTAIGVALFALKDKISFVGKAFDGLSDAMGFVIDKVKEFTDWLGISDFKAEEVKNNTIKRNEDIIASNDKKYDREIRAAKRAGKATEDLEIAKAQATIDANKVIRDTLDESDEADKIRIQEIKDANYELNEHILDLEADKNKRLKALREANRVEIKEEKVIAKEEESVEAEFDMTALVDKLEDDRLRQEEADAYALEQQKIAAANKKALADQELADEIANIDMKQAKATAGLQQAEQLTNLFFTTKLNNAKKGSKEEEKLLRQQFKINKAFQLGQAVINGAAAVTKGIAQMGPPPNPAGIAAIASAIATTGLQVAAISSTKFQGGGGSVPSAPTSAPVASLPSRSAGVSAPTLNAPANSTTQISEDGRVVSAPQVVKAFVVESDMTGKQADAKKIEEQATY